MPRRPLAVLLWACLACLAAPSAAGAARALPAPFPAIPLAGTTTKGTFAGRLEVARFLPRPDRLVVAGRLVGTLRDRRYPGPQRIRRAERFTVGLAPVAGQPCERLSVTVTGRPVRLVAFRGAIASRTVVVAPRAGAPRALGPLLCATSQALATPAVPRPIVLSLLNALPLLYR